MLATINRLVIIACMTRIVLMKAIPSLCLSVVPDFSPNALHQTFQIFMGQHLSILVVAHNKLNLSLQPQAQ